MVHLEYFNGESWIPAGGPFGNEMIAWLSLDGDDLNYRTVNTDTGEVLTDKSKVIPNEKHTTGKKLQGLYLFGYNFEIYEKVVRIHDNEDLQKNIEIQHHTFEKFIQLYQRTIK